MFQKYMLTELDTLVLPIDKPSLVFLEWDLWTGKTTLSQSIIKKFWISNEVTSPTYTYYNKYVSESDQLTIYHFDLYRISDYEEFIHIWWEEILDNNEGIILIEWPSIIGDKYKADLTISIKHTDKEDERQIEVIKKGE